MITVRKISPRFKGDPDYLVYHHDWYMTSMANVDWEMWVYPYGTRSRERIGENKIVRDIDIPFAYIIDNQERDALYHILECAGSASVALLYYHDYHHWWKKDFNPIYFSQFSHPKKIGHFVHYLIYEPDKMRWETGPAKSQLSQFYKNNFTEASIYKM